MVSIDKYLLSDGSMVFINTRMQGSLPPGILEEDFPCLVGATIHRVEPDELGRDFWEYMKQNPIQVDFFGQCSHGLDGSSFVVLCIFLFGGVLGGLLNSIGQDLWSKIKEGVRKLLDNRPSKRMTLQLFIKDDHRDFIIRLRGGTPSEIEAYIETVSAFIPELLKILDDLNTDSDSTIELVNLNMKEGFGMQIYRRRIDERTPKN